MLFLKCINNKMFCFLCFFYRTRDWSAFLSMGNLLLLRWCSRSGRELHLVMGFKNCHFGRSDYHCKVKINKKNKLIFSKHEKKGTRIFILGFKYCNHRNNLEEKSLFSAARCLLCFLVVLFELVWFIVDANTDQHDLHISCLS